MSRPRRFLAAAIAAGILAPSARAQPRGDGPPGPPNPVLQALDTDRDGRLSAAEVDGASARLRTLDADKDGQLAVDELRPGPGPGRGGTGGAPDPSQGGLARPPMPKDDQEEKILGVLGELIRGPRYANVSETDGRFLRQMAEALGARTVVELGTSSGQSGIWFALALRKTGGHLHTHELDPERIRMARENFRKAGVEDLVTIVEGDAHQTVKRLEGPIDILFLDADKTGYLDYLEQLLPKVRPGGLILAHNMHFPTPDPRYIEAITTNPDLETTFVLMDGAGIGVTIKKR